MTKMFPKPNGSAIGNQLISQHKTGDKSPSTNFALGHNKIKFILLGFMKAII